MAPATNSQNTSNTLNAPFPRTTTTTRPLTSSATNANRRPSTNPRPPVPRTGNITGSMGPPPPGRRNERFDRLFYTSPLPRSISREYNNLRASQGATAGGAASATQATTATTNATVAKTTSTTTSVPSTLQRAINAYEATQSIRTETVKPSPARPSPRNTARLNGSKTLSKAVVAATDSDDPLSAPNASSITQPSPSRTITRPATRTPATKPRVVENVRVDSNSDDEAQDVDGNNKETTSEEEQPKPPPSPLRAKRTRSPLRAPPPKKIPRTAIMASPGGVRGMRKPSPATTSVEKSEIAPRRSLLRPAQPKVYKVPKAVLPGFYVPPGILEKTGSLWDGGRRASRRISLPPANTTPRPPPRTKKVRKSLGVEEIRVESRFEDPPEETTSAADKPEEPEPTPHSDTSSDDYTDEQQSAPPPPPPPPLPPQPQLQLQRGVRRLRKSLGGRAKRFSTGATNTESESDVLVPGRIGGRVRRRSTLGATVFEAEVGRRKETANGREGETQPSRKLEKSRPKRPLMGEDVVGMDDVLSAGVEAQEWVVEETPQQVPAMKGKVRGKSKGAKSVWAIEETPQQPVERRVTRGSVSTGKKKSKRVGVGLTRGFNAEFEFSDDE